MLKPWLPAAALALVIGASPAAAQITPLTVPKGTFRFDFSGEFRSWDWRWLDGKRDEAAGDFSRPTLDAAFVPALAPLVDPLKTITGLSQIDLSLGASSASTLTNLGTIGIGGAFGLFKGVTLFGTVPIVSVKVEPRFVMFTDNATAGANPLLHDANAFNNHRAFIGELQAAAATLNTRISGGFYTDATQLALAQTTLTRTQALATAFEILLANSNYFLPRATSAVGVAVLQTITDLRQTLETLQLAGAVATTPNLPVSGIDAALFNEYLTDPEGPIQARPLDEVPVYSYLGDIELGAAVALVDRYPSSSFGSGIRAWAKTTVRLRTAQLANPNRFLDQGSGDRQPDVEMMLIGDVALGRFGARLAGGYNLQLPGNQNRRVTSPASPIAALTTLAGVRRDPGDVLLLSAQPFVRLAPYLSLYGGVDYWSKGADVYTYVAGQPPVDGVDINVLAERSKTDAVLLSGGLSYSHTGLNKRGLRGLPMDASFRYQRTLRSGMGALPDANTVGIDLRFYTRLFGRGN
ncbi:MAG: hypothetical protein AB7S39_09375 [Gemmatimonadales bacterium]